MHSDTEYRPLESPVSHLCRIQTNSELKSPSEVWRELLSCTRRGLRACVCEEYGTFWILRGSRQWGIPCCVWSHRKITQHLKSLDVANGPLQ